MFENMASRFQLLSEEDLKKLSESAENQNTKKVPIIGLKFINSELMNSRSIQTYPKYVIMTLNLLSHNNYCSVGVMELSY